MSKSEIAPILKKHTSNFSHEIKCTNNTILNKNEKKRCDFLLLFCASSVVSYSNSARFTLNNFRRTSSVGAMMQQLSWPTLEDRRQQAGLRQDSPQLGCRWHQQVPDTQRQQCPYQNWELPGLLHPFFLQRLPQTVILPKNCLWLEHPSGWASQGAVIPDLKEWYSTTLSACLYQLPPSATVFNINKVQHSLEEGHNFLILVTPALTTQNFGYPSIKTPSKMGRTGVGGGQTKISSFIL